MEINSNIDCRYSYLLHKCIYIPLNILCTINMYTLEIYIWSLMVRVYLPRVVVKLVVGYCHCVLHIIQNGWDSKPHNTLFWKLQPLLIWYIHCTAFFFWFSVERFHLEPLKSMLKWVQELASTLKTTEQNLSKIPLHTQYWVDNIVTALPILTLVIIEPIWEVHNVWSF